MTATPKASNFKEKNQFDQGKSGGGPKFMMQSPRSNPRKGGGINQPTKGTKQK
jgi:hypothetical protein